MSKTSFGTITGGFLEDAVKDENTKVVVNGDVYEVTLGKYGYLLVEYEIDNGYYFEKEGATCYVAREIEMKGDIAYKVE